jgi:DNA-binding beta-propeller fold protein YncE
MFTVGRPQNDALAYLVEGNFFLLDAVGDDLGVGGSEDSRGMTFSDDGNRLYLVNRTPPAIQLYDTSAGADGFPANQLLGASDICRDSSSVTLLNFDGDAAGTGEAINERAYVSCFDDGVVYAVDPNNTTTIEDIIQVGRGPYSVAVSKSAKLLFVSNFLEDTIAVVDVDPTSPYHNRVVLRIGTPRAPTST